jgi:hypothetical protein
MARQGSPPQVAGFFKRGRIGVMKRFIEVPPWTALLMAIIVVLGGSIIGLVLHLFGDKLDAWLT